MRERLKWYGLKLFIPETLLTCIGYVECIFQVSWIRKRDLHILTAGILTYTSDERFQVRRGAIHPERYLAPIIYINNAPVRGAREIH